jgi:hypothetical protein
MRQLLPKQFGISFSDADPALNLALTECEKRLFLNESPGKVIALDRLIVKTELTGERYSLVYDGDRATRFLRPYLFTMRVNEKHPNASRADELSRLLVLYDNAGEHFMPGREETNAPVTQHLAKSQLLMYLFDPTQDPRFRRLYESGKPATALMNLRSERQDMVLREAAVRIRRLLGLGAAQKHRKPLIVILTKCDTWGSLVGDDLSQEPWLIKDGLAGIDRNRIAKRSHLLRKLLEKTCPEFVVAADEFAETVQFVPVSALGRTPSPLKDSELDRNIAAMRPQDIRPQGVLVPLLAAINDAVPGLTLGVVRHAKETPVLLDGKTDGQSIPVGKLRT